MDTNTCLPPSWIQLHLSARSPSDTLNRAASLPEGSAFSYHFVSVSKIFRSISAIPTAHYNYWTSGFHSCVCLCGPQILKQGLCFDHSFSSLLMYSTNNYSTSARWIWGYINNSLHLARKYAQIFVRGHYLFREANSFPRAKLEENCELRGANNVQGQISEHIFKVKWRLLCLLSFKYFSQHAGISAGSAILPYVNHVKVCQLASKISTSHFASGRKRLFGEKVKHLKGK